MKTKRDKRDKIIQIRFSTKELEQLLRLYPQGTVSSVIRSLVEKGLEYEGYETVNK